MPLGVTMCWFFSSNKPEIFFDPVLIFEHNFIWNFMANEIAIVDGNLKRFLERKDDALKTFFSLILGKSSRQLNVIAISFRKKV